MTQCDNIIFHSVGKGYQDTIMYLNCAERALSKKEDYVDIIKDCVKQNQFIGASTASVRRDPNAHLTIACRKGRNAYVICLEHLSSTHFVENAAPILSLAAFYPPFENLISEVTLYYIKADGTVVGRREKDGFNGPDNSEPPQWASFVVDGTDPALPANIRASITNAVGNPLRIPLHFNLYNTVFDLPNWIAANHKMQHQKQEHDHDEQGQHHGLGFVHGGPHPDNPRNFLEIDLGP